MDVEERKLITSTQNSIDISALSRPLYNSGDISRCWRIRQVSITTPCHCHRHYLRLIRQLKAVGRRGCQGRQPQGEVRVQKHLCAPPYVTIFLLRCGANPTSTLQSGEAETFYSQQQHHHQLKLPLHITYRNGFKDISV